MQTDLTGRALDEAAARAMGWHKDEEFGNWWDSGECRGDPNFEWCEPMLAWLTDLDKRKVNGLVRMTHCGPYCDASYHDADARTELLGFAGTDLREALARLVVAVAAREAKA